MKKIYDKKIEIKKKLIRIKKMRKMFNIMKNKKLFTKIINKNTDKKYICAGVVFTVGALTECYGYYTGNTFNWGLCFGTVCVLTIL